MMNNKKLNVISYYGSKAVLCEEIIEQLEYKNSKVYVEVFGGGASVLLNKPPHSLEIYNELDRGVYILFKILSDKEKAWELIERLRVVEYTKEKFYESMKIRNKYQDNPIKECLRSMNVYIKLIEQEENLDLYNDYKTEQGNDEIIDAHLEKVVLSEEKDKEGMELITKYNKVIDKYIPEVQEIIEQAIEVIELIHSKELAKIIFNKYTKRTKTVLLHDLIDFYHNNIMGIANLSEEQNGIIEELVGEMEEIYASIEDKANEEITIENPSEEEEMDIAEAVFCLYNMSRDGMGLAFSDSERKGRNFEKKVEGLFDVVERLQDVIITNFDCFALFKDKDSLKKILNIEEFDDNEICIYLDPPYLQEAATKIDKHNPADVYKTSGFDKKKQEELVNILCDKTYNMLVSNYRDEESIYDTCLSLEKGWEAYEYQTITTVGGNASDRTEVLWINY